MFVTQGERLHLSAERWLAVVEEEYLHEYIRAGGSAVKVVSGAAETLETVQERLAELAAAGNYWFAPLDPARLDSQGRHPDLHRIDRFYLQVTREVDWRAWAATQARGFLTSRGLTADPRRRLNDLEGIALDSGRAPADLLAEYQREFATPQLRDPRLAPEFRTAITALGRAQLIPDAMTPTAEEVLLGWFRGIAVPGAAAALKRTGIYGRIQATNARGLLASFCRWLPAAGHGGLVAVLDLRPYEHKKLPKMQRQADELAHLRAGIEAGSDLSELRAIVARFAAEPEVTYTDTAWLQMLALVRRFIDEIDLFERFLLVILTTPQLYDPLSRRNYFNYDALQTRVGSEVHDLRRANPAASLVHLGEPA